MRIQKSLDMKTKKPLTMPDDEWEELDAITLSIIWLCLVDDVLFYIVEEKSATNIWSRLESLYMTKYFKNIIYLKRQLCGMKMKEGTKITKHLNVFKTLIFQLTSMDIKIDDEHKEFNLLCTLPESWGRLVSSISLSTTDTLEFDTVVGAFLSEELRKKSSFETSSPEALVVRGRSKQRG